MVCWDVAEDFVQDFGGHLVHFDNGSALQGGRAIIVGLWKVGWGIEQEWRR